MLLREALHGDSTPALSRQQAVQTGSRQRPVVEAPGGWQGVGMLEETKERTKGSLLGGPSGQTVIARWTRIPACTGVKVRC